MLKQPIHHSVWLNVFVAACLTVSQHHFNTATTTTTHFSDPARKKHSHLQFKLLKESLNVNKNVIHVVFYDCKFNT